jgi:hypothetical protein
MNATIVAWIVCGSVLATVFSWPYIQEFEGAAWNVHYETCTSRYERNKELLSMAVCDRGKNELAHLGTVDCSKARTENMWGVWPCTVWLRVQTHSVAEFARHLWNSWYAWLTTLLAMYAVVRHWFHSRTEVQKQVIMANSLRETIAAQQRMLPSLVGHGSPPMIQQQRYPGRVYF